MMPFEQFLGSSSRDLNAFGKQLSSLSDYIGVLSVYVKGQAILAVNYRSKLKSRSISLVDQRAKRAGSFYL